MAINHSRFLRSAALAFALIIGLAHFVEAQGYNPDQGAGYFLDPDSEEPRFIQRLAWIGGEYTIRYEVIIEKQEGRIYRRHDRIFTTDTFIDVSLPHGRYRFCVIPYDLLDRPGEGTDWVFIDVRHALNPELNDASQETIKDEKKTYFYLDIYADNIDPEAEIYLRASNGRIIGPEEIEFFDDGGFRLTYDDKFLKGGEYEVYVKNPGGLETAFKIVYVKPEPRFRINIGAAWMPVFKIYGDDLDWSMTIAGVAARISAVFYFSSFFFGPELTAVFHMNPESEQTRQMLNAEFGLLMGNLMLNKKLALNIRLGGGYTMLLGQEEFQGFFCANAGVSFFIHIAKHFFLEIGADYTHRFTEENYGFMRPWIGLGVQF